MLDTVSPKFKSAFGIAITLLIGIVTYCSFLYIEKQENEKILLAQKERVVDKYGQMIYYYQEVMKRNTVVNKKLEDATHRITLLKDSLQVAELNVKSLWQYQRKYIQLQKEMDLILTENEALKNENQHLAISIDSTKIILEDATKRTNTLLAQNVALANAIENASVLSANSMKVDGIIQRSSGKQKPTERARRSDKIRVCFTVAKSNLVKTGEKEVFVQVIDPKKNVLGLNKRVVFGEESLRYSLISTFNYENESLDVCEYISKANKKFEKGLYAVNVFEGKELVTSTHFELR
ncbi:chromosome partitioning protein ParA [uncultured Lacinutrix sp.]|uniref:chromosome partitioning protein ParA n=1 Tax=uncultured Lacinutrix sp. TaxID=574032 RepID=UPI00260BE2CA|nr:chromosome partitioning protein ParA [uncultured Lacinutrix sp.]